MKTIKQSQKALNEAIESLNDGDVIICPTDTVYGFLALAANEKAIEKIYKIKKRPRSKPLPVFVKDFKTAQDLAEISKEQEVVLNKYWPGKYTFVLNKKNNKGTIALRIPKYKFLNDLLKKINKPLVQTSVNVSGRPAIVGIKEIMEVFGSKPGVNLIIDAGNLQKSNQSTIIDLSKEDAKIIRK
jgi:L-threonylcarbamoyladenylate synthase